MNPSTNGRPTRSWASKTPKDPNEPQPTLRERWAQVVDAYENVRRAFVLVWEAHPSATVLMGLISLVGALLAPGQAYVAKLIVDNVVAAVESGLDAGGGLQRVLPYLALEFGLLFLGALLKQARALVEHVLHARLNYKINSDIIRKALALDLSFFENPEFYDKLQNARREADFRGLRIVNGGFYLIQNLITLLSYGALVVQFNPWLALILYGATIPAFIAQNRYARLSFRMLTWRAPEARRLQYIEYLLTVDESVKEVKLFGLGEPLLGRYAELFWKFLREDEGLARKRSLASLGWGLVSTLSYYASYAWIVYYAVGAPGRLGDMTLYLTVFRQSQSTFEGLFNGLNELYEHGLFMSNLFGFLALEPQMQPSATPRPLPERISQGVEFRDVSFRYAGREDWALRHVNLKIAPGETLALVGKNGAGKTTLVKLLTRLYDPTEGQVLLDGVDLRDYDLNALRQRIGVIFQDFMRYNLTARDNVGFGQIEALADEDRILHAAQRSGAHPVIAEMPKGYETMLGRWFDAGYQLSGGEWQKIALARAFMRDSEVLVLDEPTAALDAENEVAVFQRFRELTAGRIAVLISHRFSTVRMADRIAVIEDGAISELGSHAELLAQGGTYARLFNVQAEGYR